MSYRMMSFSINFEDVVLQRAFDLDHRGFYIDIGAAHPIDQSDTKQFYDRGWRGINVEPNPSQFALLAADRLDDINLRCGVSNHSGEMTLFEKPGEACWSADQSFLTGYYAAGSDAIIEHRVPVLTLAEICDRHVPAGQVIDFLKIDVEGHEAAVIAGGDWHRYRPRIVLAEATDIEEWDAVLQSHGYHFTLFDGVNRFYVRDEDAHLIPKLSVPANISDEFGMSNYVRIIHQMSRQISELEQGNAELVASLERTKTDTIHIAAAAVATAAEAAATAAAEAAATAIAAAAAEAAATTAAAAAVTAAADAAAIAAAAEAAAAAAVEAQQAERDYPASIRLVRNVVHRFRRGA